MTGPTAPWLSREVVITSCFTGDGVDSPVGTAGEVSKPIASAMIADLTANITSPSLKRTIGFGEDLCGLNADHQTAYLTGRARSSSANRKQYVRSRSRCRRRTILRLRSRSGGLGTIILMGIDQSYTEKILVGGLLTALLATVFDIVLTNAEKALRRWQSAGR